MKDTESLTNNREEKQKLFIARLIFSWHKGNRKNGFKFTYILESLKITNSF